MTSELTFSIAARNDAGQPAFLPASPPAPVPGVQEWSGHCPAPNANVTYRLIDDPDQLAPLEAEWNALFARAGRPTSVFQTFDWSHQWCHAYHPTQQGTTRLAIMTAWRQDRLVLVMPFVIERHAGIRCLKWMGEPVTQYGDILVDRLPDAVAIVSGAWNALLRQSRPDAAWLRYVRADAAFRPFLIARAARQIDNRQAPYLDLTSHSTHEDFMSRYGAKARKNRRRLARRLDEFVPVDHVAVPAGAAARPLAEAAIALKHQWLRNRHTYSTAFADQRIDTFFATLAASGAINAEPVVFAIRANEKPIATAIALICQHHAMLHILAYDEDYARFGIGVQVFENVIRYCIANGIERLDLLAPASGFKASWTDTSVDVADYALPLTLSGSLYVRGFITGLRPAIRSIAAWRSRTAPCRAKPA